ncbi:hypothetical protein CEC48_13310 [Pseudomonas sp. K2I15]|nr:hypothetical protein CEC48_13310 [Pseudomonas sp. K2I15]
MHTFVIHWRWAVQPKVLNETQTIRWRPVIHIYINIPGINFSIEGICIMVHGQVRRAQTIWTSRLNMHIAIKRHRTESPIGCINLPSNDDTPHKTLDLDGNIRIDTHVACYLFDGRDSRYRDDSSWRFATLFSFNT